MSGRGGRGRGRSALSFDISHLGFSSGEPLPHAALQPPPSYPPLQQRPTPLGSTEVDEYLLALSQEYRGSIRDSPFYLKPKTVKKDIVRYTDRYKQNQKIDNDHWEPDWNYLPAELKPSVKRRVASKAAVNVKAAKQHKKSISNVDVVKKLELLAAKVEVKEENVEEENEDEEQFEEYEEEFEDDNDYNFDYYNDGGDKYGDDDDGEEGPVY